MFNSVLDLAVLLACGLAPAHPATFVPLAVHRWRRLSR
jgi:hypothetical protein